MLITHGHEGRGKEVRDLDQRMQRKILHVIPTLDQSGAEKQLTLLATRLPKEKFAVEVVALTRGGFYEQELRAAGIPVHVLNKRFRWDPLVYWRLSRLIKKLKPDLVQTWLFAANCYGRIAAKRAGVRRIVASERCVDEWKKPYELMIDRYLAKTTDAIIVNSQAVKSFYVRSGIDANKIQVIANAVPELPVADQPTSRDREEILGELGIDPNGSVIGYLGRLWPQKRVQDLIWATDALRIGGWRTPLLIAGDGPRRPALERFTRNLELEGVVRFLGHRSDPQRVLSAIDVVVIPSRFEGMPNVALEAMRAGKPVVATRIDGMDEVVVDGETGFLVPPKQPFEIARAIARLLRDADLRQRMGDAGRQRVQSLFTVHQMIDGYVKLYDYLLSDSQTG